MREIPIPPALVRAVEEDGIPARDAWLASLPSRIAQIASGSSLKLGQPYLPGGQCAWVAPARAPTGDEVVLKVGWRHPEAEHEAEALRHWNGRGAVCCHAARTLDDSAALLLECCVPGRALNRAMPEPEQDVVIAGVLRRLWERQPGEGHPFAPLQEMCDAWVESLEHDFAGDPRAWTPA